MDIGDYEEKFDGLVSKLSFKGVQDAKRALSFDILDGCLEKCQGGICPNFKHQQHIFLVDISIFGYAETKTHSMRKKGEGQNDRDRYDIALKRAKSVFKCTANPTFKLELFNKDDFDLKFNKDHLEAAKRRKAYWRSCIAKDMKMRSACSTRKTIAMHVN